MRFFHTLLILLPLVLVGQGIDPGFTAQVPRGDHLLPGEAPPAYVLRSGGALRNGPSMDAGLVKTLAAGEPVMVEERHEDRLRIDGINSNWYRVVAGDHTGWTWGGNLAIHAFGSVADPMVKFMVGHDSYTPLDTVPSGLVYRIVAVRDGRELDRITVRSFSLLFEGVQTMGSRGLPNVDDVIVLDVPCIGGCGCTTGAVMVFWSNGRLRHAADIAGTPDGAYSSHTSLIFPSDMEGLPETIVRVTSEYDDSPRPEQEDDGVGEHIERIVRYEYLRWNGEGLVPTGRTPHETRYRMCVD